MTVRFFMLQSHYRSTLDFSNDALKAAQKGYRRLANGLRIVKTLTYTADEALAPDTKKQVDVQGALQGFHDALNDDLNTAVAIAHLFTLLKYVNMIYMNQLRPATLGEEVFESMKASFVDFTENVLGLLEETGEGHGVVEGMLTLYREYKEQKLYDKVDQVRTYFKQQGLVIKDMKHRIDWAYEE